MLRRGNKPRIQQVDIISDDHPRCKSMDKREDAWISEEIGEWTETNGITLHLIVEDDTDCNRLVPETEFMLYYGLTRRN